jgi:hypothetical protein
MAAQDVAVATAGCKTAVASVGAAVMKSALIANRPKDLGALMPMFARFLHHSVNYLS